MGYQKPSYDEVEETAAQFEWDGDNQRWLFRRNGRGAPVVVTDEEKEWCESIQRRGTVALMILFAIIYIFGGSWAESVYASSINKVEDLRLPIGISLALVIFVLGNALVDRIATRQFRNRQPQGPARTRMDNWRLQMRQKNWMDFVWPVVVVVAIFALHLPPREWGDWVWLAIAGCIVAFILFEALLKRETSRL